jgi:hypothetical protein
MQWAQMLAPGRAGPLNISFDGKTIPSTGKMGSYDSPLHIISAHLSELGITIGQMTVEEKNNEIPAVRELVGFLAIEGCMVVTVQRCLVAGSK